MKDYILVPSFFDLSKIKSPALESFLSSVKIESNKINLNYFREFYSQDPSLGLIVRNELRVRGFKFILREANNFLKNIENDRKNLEVIYTESDSGKIKRIKQRIFSQFDYRNLVKSDFYFNLIPLYTFEDDYLLAKEEFKKYGYSILKVEEIRESEVVGVNRDNNCETINLRDIVRMDMVANKNIIEYLEGLGIYTLEDLKYKEDFDFDGLLELRSVGIKAVEDFKNILNKDEYALLEILNEKKDGYLGAYCLRDEFKERYEDILPILQATHVKVVLNKETNTDKRVLSFLEKEDIDTLDLLLDYDLRKIKSIKGVGEKFISDLVDNINKELTTIKKNYSKVENFVVPEFLEKESIGDIYFALKNERLKEHQYFKDNILGAYKNISLSNVYNMAHRNAIYRLFSELISVIDIGNNLSLIEDIFTNINDRDRKILELRLKDEKTLEEIGQQFDLSRERIRQISYKRTKNINSALDKVNFRAFITFQFYNREYISFYELEELLTHENILLLSMIKNNEIDNFYYIKELNRVYINYGKKEIKLLEDKFRFLFENLKESGNIKIDIANNIEEFENIFGDLSLGQIKTLLNREGYTIKANYYFKYSPTNTDYIEIIFKDFIKEPLVLDDKGVQVLNKYYSELFDIDMCKTEGDARRAYNGIISRIDEIFLVGPATFIYKDKAPISLEARIELQNILEELEDRSIITAESVYNTLDTRLRMHGFLSKQHVYSFIKYEYANSYESCQGNSLDLFKKGDTFSKYTNSDIMNNLCLASGGIISMEKVKKTLQWKEPRINAAIVNSEKMIRLENVFVSLDIIMEDEERTEFLRIINKAMEPGYSSVSFIEKEFKFNKITYNFLKKYDLLDFNLSNLIKYLDRNIEGHTQFIYYKDQDIRTIGDLILVGCGEIIYRKEIEEVLQKYNINSNYMFNIISDLLEEGKLIQIGREKYKRPKSLNIDSDIVQKVVAFADEVYSELGYYIPQNYIYKFIDEFGYIEDGWTQYLVSYILEQNGYKLLKRHDLTYKNEILVLVRDSNKIEDIGVLVHNILSLNYTGALYKNPVYDYLASLGFYEDKKAESEKKLKKDILNSGLISVDNYGQVRLK